MCHLPSHRNGYNISLVPSSLEGRYLVDIVQHPLVHGHLHIHPSSTRKVNPSTRMITVMGYPLLRRIILMILMWTNLITNHFINQLFSGLLSVFYLPIKRIKEYRCGTSNERRTW